MNIKQMITALIQYDSLDVNIDGNRYFSQSDIEVSFKNIEDVIEKCKEKLNSKWDEYKIEIKHDIFDHEINLNNLTYEDFVFKYGPCTHYFTNDVDKNDIAFNNKNSDVTYLEKLSGELLYPEDFRKTPNKFNCGDICIVNHLGEKWYGVIYKTPSSLYDSFGEEKPYFERGYFVEALNGDRIWDFDHVSEFDIESVDSIPERYKEFLKLLSKLFKLNIKEECFDLDMVEDMAQEYFENTEKWREYRDHCLEKIKEKENK